MTPQPRHIDTASRWVPAYVLNANTQKALIEGIAAALADAENRAAWDVKLNQPSESTYEWVEAKYGPRPTDAAEEVGNE